MGCECLFRTSKDPSCWPGVDAWSRWSRASRRFLHRSSLHSIEVYEQDIDATLPGCFTHLTGMRRGEAPARAPSVGIPCLAQLLGEVGTEQRPGSLVQLVEAVSLGIARDAFGEKIWVGIGSAVDRAEIVTTGEDQ